MGMGAAQGGKGGAGSAAPSNKPQTSMGGKGLGQVGGGNPAAAQFLNNQPRPQVQPQVQPQPGMGGKGLGQAPTTTQGVGQVPGFAKPYLQELVKPQVQPQPTPQDKLNAARQFMEQRRVQPQPAVLPRPMQPQERPGLRGLGLAGLTNRMRERD